MYIIIVIVIVIIHKQIGVVTYSTTVEKAIPLALHDVNDLEEAIWNLDFMAGTTNTADAIAAMVEMFNRGKNNNSTKHKRF